MQIEFLELNNNLLTGPAFPTAWTLHGALSGMVMLDVSGNRGLTGTLPADMSFWPSLTGLYLGNTSLHGTVPQQWCSTGFGAPSLQLV